MSAAIPLKRMSDQVLIIRRACTLVVAVVVYWIVSYNRACVLTKRQWTMVRVHILQNENVFQKNAFPPLEMHL